MDRQLEQTLKDILAEAEGTGKANITPQDLDSLKALVNSGYQNQEILDIINDKDLRRKVLAEKIYEISLTSQTVTLVKEALQNRCVKPGSVKSVETKDPAMQSVRVWFDRTNVDGVVLLQNNAVAVYRKGLQLPSVIFCRNPDEAESVYKNLTE